MVQLSFEKLASEFARQAELPQLYKARSSNSSNGEMSFND